MGLPIKSDISETKNRYILLTQYLQDSSELDELFEEYVEETIKYRICGSEVKYKLDYWLDMIEESAIVVSLCDEIQVYEFVYPDLEELRFLMIEFLISKKQGLTECLSKNCWLQLSKKNMGELRSLSSLYQLIKDTENALLSSNLDGTGVREVLDTLNSRNLDPYHLNQSKLLNSEYMAQYVLKIQRVIEANVKTNNEKKEVKEWRKVQNKTKGIDLSIKFPELTKSSRDTDQDSNNVITSELPIEIPEQELQKSLRENLYDSLGLEASDGGEEYMTKAGYIDILGSNGQSNNITVVELKKGKAGDAAIGQLLGYMSSIEDEHPESDVSGMLIARDFSTRVIELSKKSKIRLVKYEGLIKVSEL